MIVVGSFASQFAEAVGMTAAAIAVGGFLAHAPWALGGAEEDALRQATVGGGLFGFALAAFVIVLSS